MEIDVAHVANSEIRKIGVCANVAVNPVISDEFGGICGN